MKEESGRISVDEFERAVVEKIKVYTQISPVYNSAIKAHYRKYLQNCARLLKLDFELEKLRSERDELHRRARLAEIDREVERYIDDETDDNWLESQIAPPMYDGEN